MYMLRYWDFSCTLEVYRMLGRKYSGLLTRTNCQKFMHRPSSWFVMKIIPYTRNNGLLISVVPSVDLKRLHIFD